MSAGSGALAVALGIGVGLAATPWAASAEPGNGQGHGQNMAICKDGDIKVQKGTAQAFTTVGKDSAWQMRETAPTEPPPPPPPAARRPRLAATTNTATATNFGQAYVGTFGDNLDRYTATATDGNTVT